MAENESLVLGDPYAWRWKAVCEAVRKGQPPEDVAKKAEKKLYEGLRKALKQLAEKGISLEMLLDNRESPRTLQRLLKQSEGHGYLSLFAQTARTETDCGTQELLQAFVGGVWDTMSDQIAQNVTGSERWPNFVDVQIFLDGVQGRIEPGAHRIAEKLAANPSWMPTCKPEKNADKTNPTAEMLGLSLLGIQKK